MARYYRAYRIYNIEKTIRKNPHVCVYGSSGKVERHEGWKHVARLAHNSTYDLIEIQTIAAANYGSVLAAKIWGVSKTDSWSKVVLVRFKDPGAAVDKIAQSRNNAQLGKVESPFDLFASLAGRGVVFVSQVIRQR